MNTDDFWCFEILDHVPVGIFILGKDFTVIFWNRCLEEWTGIPAGGIIGQDAGVRFPHLKSAKYAMRLKDIFEGGPPTIFSSQLHGSIIPSLLSNGEQRVQHVTVTPIRASNAAGFHALFSIQDVSDLTRRIRDYRAMRDRALQEVEERNRMQDELRRVREQRKIEEDLLRARKLESVGVLAGGIAHDFNNLLTAILGNVSLARMYLEEEDEAYERLVEAEKASIRAKDLTRQLLMFSCGVAPVKKKATVLGELIKSAAAEAAEGYPVRCNFSVAADLLPAEVDEGQIRQVIQSLIVNACQAMEEGGTIQVLAENVTIKPEDILPLSVGSYVKLAVSDQGIGIPGEDLGRIFDPYFTTKKKASGLGLTNAYSIIKSHNGFITVESQPGEGTTFYVFLPASRAGTALSKGADESTSAKGRVLVVDDEELVRLVAGKILNKIGYDVEYASDGSEAAEIYRNAMGLGQSFDAVLMDLTIPGGIGGIEALERLMEVDPEVKVIVSSGYANDPIMADYARFGFKGVVAKPYTIKEISDVLRTVLKEGADNPS